MEVLAMFDAWAHAEANLDYRDMAEYTPQELSRLQLGYLLREHGPEARRGLQSGGSLSHREYDAERSKRAWLNEIEKN